MSGLLKQRIDRRRGLVAAIQKRCLVLAYLSVLVLLLGQMGSLYWFLELFSHFTPWYGLGLVLGVVVMANKYLRVVFIVLLVVVVGSAIIGVQVPKATMPSRVGHADKIISWNVNINSASQIQDHELAILEQADKLFLMEYGSAWDYRLPRDWQQRYRCGLIEDSPFGMAFFSQEVPLACEVQYTDDYRQYPYVRVEFPTYVLYGVHPPPPINGQLAQSRLEAFAVLSKRIVVEKKGVVVLGDLNNTPFSPVFRRFIQASHLYSIKPNAQATWQGLLSIDHVLLSQGMTYQNTGVLPQMGGSDHRAVFVDLLK